MTLRTKAAIITGVIILLFILLVFLVIYAPLVIFYVLFGCMIVLVTARLYQMVYDIIK